MISLGARTAQPGSSEGSPLVSAASFVVGLGVRLLVGLVRLYQKTLSRLLPAIFGPNYGCRFYPSCSHYAIEALQVHGALKGSWLSMRRLLRCTALSKGGPDPVPPRKSAPTCHRA